CHHIKSTTYHPQTNGAIERFNSTFERQLAKLTNKCINDWDIHLKSIVFAYNTGSHAVTKFTPYELQFGRRPQLPPEKPLTTYQFSKSNDCIFYFNKTSKIYRQHAVNNIFNNQKNYKKFYDHNRPEKYYSIGDHMLKRIPTQPSKVGELYSNPMIIIKKQHPTYFLQDVDNKKIYQVHVSQLPLFSPYQSPYTYQINFINQSTSSQDLDYLIDVVQTSTDFIIDTESAFKSFDPVITHDLQSQFKTWFNTWITSYDSTSINESITTDDVVIINAPTYDPHLLLPTSLMNKKKFNSHESWSLQHAVLYTFGLHLSKRETLRQSAIGLDINLPTCDRSFSINYRQKLINYACLDCVSVAHINLFMHQSELPLDLTFVKEQIITGEYFVSTKPNVASYIFQIDDDSSSSSFEQIDAQVMVVHVPNDRHQSMPLITSMDSQHLVSASPLELLPDEAITNLNSQSVECSPHKRSNNAKRRKNQKSSLRHRRNIGYPRIN
ncbi:unnamed protein product, partial [Rotaria magnacalcarata]